MRTTVVNKYYQRGTVYIGRRRSGMHYGNPFTHMRGVPGTIPAASRGEAVARFRSWLLRQTDQDVEPARRKKWILANLPALAGKELECFCKPAACHGDVLAEMVDAVNAAT